jgi:uncharacterized membrane protein YedE/YeeE
MQFYQKDRWSPYLVGLSIGLLLLFLLMLKKQLGASGGITQIAGLISYLLFPEYTINSSYFQVQLKDHIIFNYRLVSIIGLFLGAFTASYLNKEKVPPKNTLWTLNFGNQAIRRNITIFIGGILLIFGARLAGGCTSGHAISGGGQLATTSFVFMIFVFATAIPTAFILYRNKGD